MKKTDAMIASAIAGVLALAVVSSVSADEKKAETEKCYGVAKAGKNDCQTSTSALRTGRKGRALSAGRHDSA